jgi:hypothetical protein
VNEAELVALLHGRPRPTEPVVKPQPSSGFDGGANRIPVPVRPDNPFADHNEVVVELVRVARTFRHGGGFAL